MNALFSRAAVAAPLALACAAAHAHHEGSGRADSHAPIGVMRDHTHQAGEFMLSYRFMRMGMEGNRIGSDGVSPETIATTVPARFAMPPTLRVVPLDMRMDMHMAGAMWAPIDRVTLMAMSSYVIKEMDHVTFAGMAGSERLGTFRTRTAGFGDTTLSVLIKAWSHGAHRVHVSAGVSAPTGSIDETDDVLTPMGTRPTVTLPYPMQLGSGTWDLRPGVTYAGRKGRFGFGAQYDGTIRIGENNADYALGDKHMATAWASLSIKEWVSLSMRAAGSTQGSIEGRDIRIAAPVQTADPDFQGGDRIDLGFGVNFAGRGPLRGHRFAVEAVRPVHQDLNGPQLETDYVVTAGWQWTWYQGAR